MSCPTLVRPHVPDTFILKYDKHQQKKAVRNQGSCGGSWHTKVSDVWWTQCGHVEGQHVADRRLPVVFRINRTIKCPWCLHRPYSDPSDSGHPSRSSFPQTSSYSLLILLFSVICYLDRYILVSRALKFKWIAVARHGSLRIWLRC